MKKFLILLAALLVLSSGCAKEEIPLNEPKPETEAIQLPDENPPAEMKAVSFSDSEITVSIKNISEAEVIFSEDYNLQFKENGKWYSLGVIQENVAFNDIALLLAPGETREWSVDFTWLYGKIPEGEYRIIKHVSTEESGECESFKVAAEFEIKPETEAKTEGKIPFEYPAAIPENEEKPAPENTYVLRSNSPSGGSESLLWYHAENENKGGSSHPVIVIENMNELTSLLMDTEGIYFWGDMENSADKQLKKYGEDFFENNVLIISHIRATSGSVRYEVKKITAENGKCTLTVSAKIPQYGTADIADWFVICEQPKEFLEGISEYEMKISVKK